MDPLDQPDVSAVADAAASENLLRCWTRELDLRRPDGGVLRIPLEATGVSVSVPVLHWSATGWHRFGSATVSEAPHDARPVDAVLLAALLGREAVHRAGGDALGEHSAAFVARVADSLHHTGEFLAHRRTAFEPLTGSDPFLEGEQSLVLGHPVHPAPKSRQGLSDSEAREYAPELRGSFSLHWMAVDISLLACDSAWYEDGGGGGAAVSAAQLAARLAGEEVVARTPEDFVPVPLHPWQAREVRHRPQARRLLETGRLRDLGVAGRRWYPTSSVRTVHQPGADVMLKLSLALRITNSRRENLRKEMVRGLEVHRLLRAGLADRWHGDHPGFDIVRDPAWLGVNTPEGEPLSGLDAVIRHNPFGPSDDAVCLASLTSPRPWPGADGYRLCSRLADLVERLATRTGWSISAVSVEWFQRYLRSVVEPVLWFDTHAGIALEAHQQNTLVLLDADGWPAGGRYRDNQGYYFRASHRENLTRRLPGVGVASESFVADEVIDERFAYYLGINNVYGLIGAFGSQGLADEVDLLDTFRCFLEEAAVGDGTTSTSPLPALLLRAPMLRCKANLLTRVHGMDELVGPVDTQSVYVAVTNPLGSPNGE